MAERTQDPRAVDLCRFGHANALTQAGRQQEALSLLLTEGIGLLMRKHWAEYFTVISTAVFIPLEVYEIFHRFTLTKVGVLAVNVAICSLASTLASVAFA